MLQIKVKNIKNAISYKKINDNYNSLILTGRFGNIKKYLRKEIMVTINNDLIELKATNNNTKLKMLLQNYFFTIKQRLFDLNYGFIVLLEMRGVGFKVYANAGLLTFAIGYSHKIKFELPDFVISKVLDDKNTIFYLMGNNRETVISTAIQICSLKNIDSYKGKGIFFLSDKLKLKEGKGKKKV
jgi:large subunit ribosomal protein L6